MGVRDGRWLSWIAGLALGAAVGAVVPFEVARTAVGPVAAPPPPPRPAAPLAPSPRSAPLAARPAPQDERAAHLEQRRAFLSAWGRPPLPASADQPDEAEVLALLEEVTDDTITLVDCYTYPCVAVLYGGDWQHDGVRERIRARYPHASFGLSWYPLRDGLIAEVTTVALLDAPVEPRSAEDRFVQRLMDVAHARMVPGDMAVNQEIEAELDAEEAP